MQEPNWETALLGLVVPSVKSSLALLAFLSAVLAQPRVCAATRGLTGLGSKPGDAEANAAILQNAIDSSQPGDTLCIPEGSFLIHRTLRLRSEVKLRGAGSDRTVLRLAAKTPTDFFDLSSSWNVELSDLTLDGEGSLNARHGIFAHNGGGHYLHHLVIKNLGSTNGPLGIHLTGDGGRVTNGVTDCILADNVLRNIGVESEWGGGIRLSWGSSRNRIIGNVVDNTGRGGILANDGSSDLVIRSNLVTRSGRRAEKLGIEVWRDCDRVVIEDNQIDHWLSIGGAARVAARRNRISAPPGDIAFIGLELIGQDLIVTDNVVDGGQQIGVSVSNNASNQWHYCAYNIIRNMVQWGAQLQGDDAGARMLYFYKNKFLAAQRGNPAAIYPGADGRGFRFNGNCQQVVLDSNEIKNNRAEGIELGGKRVDQISLIGNVIARNGLGAVSGDPGIDLEWTNNTVAGNGRDTQIRSRGFRTPKPTAAFSCFSRISAGISVVFTNRSVAVDGPLEHLLWDFGEGVPSTSRDGSHTYSREGSYRVTLIVWDNHGRAAMQEQTIRVGPPAD